MTAQDRATAVSTATFDDRLLADIGVSHAQIWLAARPARKRPVLSGLAALMAWLCFVAPSAAQPAAPPTPTTRILAIGTVNPGVDPATVRSILPTEVRETVKLYLDGKIDQWFSLQGRSGVAFILNVTDPVAAHAMLENLPLGQAHLMSFELIPLAPLNPLRLLQGTAASPPRN